MPLKVPLGHINVWLLEDRDGWTLVDTGIHSEESFHAWRSVFTGVMRDRPLVRIIATHMHPDHLGLAGWLTRRFGCELWISRLEYLMCRLLLNDTGRPPPGGALNFYRRAGWDHDELEQYALRFGEFGKHVFPLPERFHRIVANDQLVIGGRRWQAVVGRGHSPEHVCLYCEDLKIMISGDQVLPRISSNVSVFPLEPDANPLREWMESLRNIRHVVPADTLVLPAHGEPFLGLHQRADNMLEHHADALDRLHKALASPMRAVDTYSLLFKREVKGRLVTVATGESLAHLNYLIHQGCVCRSTDAQGVDWYQAEYSCGIESPVPAD